VGNDVLKLGMTVAIHHQHLIHSGDSTTTTTETNVKSPTLNLQIGANTGNSFLVDLTDARTATLGINELVVDTRIKANEAIALIEKAIQLVYTERTKYRAYQNSLEHINSNVTYYKVNLTASASRIRDLDMPKKITKLTNNQVVLQSAQAMLAQENQSSQNILEFLK